MNFKDRWADNDKGEKYIFTVEMQRKLFEAGEPVTPEGWMLFQRKVTPPPASARGERQRETPKKPIITKQIDPATGKFIGILKDYNRPKAFGFIERGDGEDIFFHKKQALDDPDYMSLGQKVLYNITVFRGKEEAVEVEIYE